MTGQIEAAPPTGAAPELMDGSLPDSIEWGLDLGSNSYYGELEHYALRANNVRIMTIFNHRQN